MSIGSSSCSPPRSLRDVSLRRRNTVVELPPWLLQCSGLTRLDLLEAHLPPPPAGGGGVLRELTALRGLRELLVRDEVCWWRWVLELRALTLLTLHLDMNEFDPEEDVTVTGRDEIATWAAWRAR